MWCKSTGTVLLVAAGVAAVLARPGLAEPTSDKPDAALDVRSENKPLLEAAAQLDNQVHTTLRDALEKLAQNQLDRVDAREINKAYVAMSQLDRQADQLVVRGEPAGKDFQNRVTKYRADFIAIVNGFREDPAIVARLKRDEQVMMAGVRKHQAKLPAIGALAKRKEWEAAEGELYEKLDELASMAMWYSMASRKKVFVPFQAAREVIDREVVAARAVIAQAALGQAIDQRIPDLAGLTARVVAAAEGVRTNGAADDNGELLDGPQLMQRFGEQWKAAHVAALQCWALNEARRGATKGGTWPAADKLLQEHVQFDQQMVAAMAGLIEADAAQAAEGDVRSRYLAYLPVVAELSSLSPEGGWQRAAEPALQKLAQRSPALADEVAAYRAATDDLLRWRRRTAAAYAAARARQFPPIGDKLIEVVRADKDLRSLLPASAGRSSACGLSSPAPAVMKSLTETLVGQEVTAPPVLGTPTSQRLAGSRCDGRHYVRFPIQDTLQAEQQLLNAELLVGSSAEPLTLRAAAAISTARRGDLVAAGGRIESISLNGMLTQFAELPLLALVIAPDGIPPARLDAYDPVAQVMLRFGLEPLWMQHEYFFVDLVPAAPGA